MAYPAAAGVPSLASYIPIVYAPKLLVEFYASSVVPQMSNTDYEGSIKGQGDTVRIRKLPDITVGDYVKAGLGSTQSPDPSHIDLLIDKGKYIKIALNDLDRVQSDIEYRQQWISHAAEKMREAIDTDVLADVYADAHANNAGLSAGVDSGDINLGVTGTPFELTKTTVMEKIVDCGVVLDEQKVPEQGRYIVLPPWAIGMLKKSDIKDASMTGDTVSPIRNGQVGRIDRFMVYQSTLLSRVTDTVSCWHCMFGHPIALTFATQLTQNETLRNYDDFGDIWRSLNVFGYKVVKPEALGHLYVKKG